MVSEGGRGKGANVPLTARHHRKMTRIAQKRRNQISSGPNYVILYHRNKALLPSSATSSLTLTR